MHLSDLSAWNFRSFEEINLHFPKGVSLFIGPNGSGKSNLMEAIYYALGGKSFRTRRDLEIIRFDQAYFRTEALIIKEGLKKKIKILYEDQNGRKIEVNEKEYTKSSQLFFETHVVIFTPSSSSLIKGGPSLRRHFLDRISLKINPEYSLILSKYQQTLKARNTLLKTKSLHHMDRQLYEVLSDELIRYSRIIQSERHQMLELFNQQLENIRVQFPLFGIDSIQWTYQPFSKFQGSLSDLLQQESRRGISIIGAHLDLVDVQCNAFLAKNYSSDGEIKMMTILAKLCEFETIEKKSRITPILLLDDLSSELDGAYLSEMLDYIKNKNQVFISSLNALSVNSNLTLFLERDMLKICNS